MIRNVRPFLNKESLYTLDNILVLPYLTFCTLEWGDKNNVNLESLYTFLIIGDDQSIENRKLTTWQKKYSIYEVRSETK